jgi:ABC-type polysaccharide/polyol phosphate export permease
MARVLRVDLSYFFRTKWLIATLVTLNLSDMLVAGLVYSRMMDFNYFVFFAPGVVVAGMFAAALDVGRRVYLGLSEGVTQYYLSLPMSLNGLAFAHILSAGLGGTIYGSILLAAAVIVVPRLASIATLALIPFMFVVSMGLGGITAVLNLFTKGGDRYWVYAEGIQISLLGLSTVFYPLSVIGSFLPSYLVVFVTYNPLSLVADALRSVITSPASLTPAMLGEMCGASLVLLFCGFLCYRYVFARVREAGKV